MDLARVDLNLLVVLDALLQEQNVTRAGRRLCLSQPATSTALARLRKLFDDPLLVRNGRRLQLTPRAVDLVEPVRDVLAAIDHVISHRPQFDPATSDRTFTIVASDYVGIVLIRPLLARLAAEAGHVRIVLRSLAGSAKELLERDEVDLVITPGQVLDTDRLPQCRGMPVINDRFVGVAWRGLPWSGNDLTADMLVTQPYLTWSDEAGVSVVEAQLDALGLDRTVEATASSFVVIPFLLRGTGMVALLPERLAVELADAAELRLLTPRFPLAPVRQMLLWHTRRDLDAGHRWLREQILAIAATAGVGPVPDMAAVV